jgi:hypothetical protein
VHSNIQSQACQEGQHGTGPGKSLSTVSMPQVIRTRTSANDIVSRASHTYHITRTVNSHGAPGRYAWHRTHTHTRTHAHTHKHTHTHTHTLSLSLSHTHTHTHTPACLLEGLTDPKKMVPIMQWLPLYDRQKCVGDVIAGVTIGFMVIPQGLLIALSSEQFDAVLTVGVGLCTHSGLLRCTHCRCWALHPLCARFEVRPFGRGTRS